MAQNKESLPASTLGDTLGETTVILKLFDTAAAALCAYDQENNGQGKVLLLRDRFPRSADPRKKHKMLDITKSIHALLKACSPTLWYDWYYAQHKTLDTSLSAARDIINKASPDLNRFSVLTQQLFLERALNSAQPTNLPPQPKNE